MTYDNTHKVIKEIFESLLSRYQIGLETPLKEGYFICDSVQLLYNKFEKMYFKRGRSYMESHELIKIKNSNNKFEK